MKTLIPLLLLLIFMVSCKKEKVATNIVTPPPQHVPDRRELLTALVSKICGNYSTTVICRTTGEPADTTYNYPLTIVALNDTTIFTCGKQLFFVGNFDTKSYYFVHHEFGLTYSASIDSMITGIHVSTYEGGQPYGTGCEYQPN